MTEIMSEFLLPPHCACRFLDGFEGYSTSAFQSAFRADGTSLLTE
ncbi:hypothetical protein [Pseudochelatococcus contaminans]|uniref:Uncharacterized protein n=1 Tax=Pseudochelatococcus contaminans TaxID=1538103 RepID=A0A7W6EE51_9HYPH|nr:hypothetical protein [Pseudochelatococcus contaminans]MBB3807965.1 hypothetical protein [Pseudochelatococcus contaminans]